MSKRRLLYTVEPYSYRRYLGYTYKKVKGRRRRVHHFKTVHVSGYSVYEKIKPKPKPKPKAKKEAPKEKAHWLNVRDYEYQLKTVKSYHGHEITEMEMPIYHSDLDNDSIHIPSLFVWPVRKFPHHLPKLEKRFQTKKLFNIVRIWFIVRNDDEDELQVWCRTARIFQADFSELYSQAVELHSQAQADQAEYNSQPVKKGTETPKGFTVEELVAWTGYLAMEKAPTRMSSKEGGSQ